MTRSAVLRSIAVAAAMGALRVVTAAEPEAPSLPALPDRLSETGLYLDIATGKIDVWNLPFEPQYPLWTDRAAKARWIRIPDGTTIDASDVDAWRFPVGTKLWKEFSFGGKKIETRMLWHATEETWLFASYVWNDDQTEAFLAPEQGIRNHTPVAPGVAHSIPGRRDCLSCHGSAPSPVLGFSALQLSDDRDPRALHAQPLKPGMVTLRTLDTYRLLSPRRRDLVDDPPRIRASSPVERAALGYFAGNCGHCHNDRGPLASLGLQLAHPIRRPRAVAPAIATAVDVHGSFVVPGVEEEASRRIAPGAPESSAVIYRMASRRPSSQMPPLGTVLPDTEALELIAKWIREEVRRP